MANEDIRILISANLNIGKSLQDINNSIRAIEKHPSLQKIKLKVEIDQYFTKSINGFINAVAKMKRISDEQTKVVETTQEVYKKLDGTITTVNEKILANGERIKQTKIIHDENRKAMQDETIAAQKLAEAIDKQNKAELDSIAVLKNKANAITGIKVISSKGYTVTTQRLEGDGQTLIGSTITTNYKKQRQDELKAQEQLNKEAEKLDRDHFMALRDNNKRIEDMEKLHYLALQKNAQRDLDFQQSIAREKAKIDDIERRFGKDNNVKSALVDLNAQLSNITSIGNYKNAINDVDIQLKKIVSTAKTAGSNIQSFSQQFKIAAQRIPLWMAAMTAFYFPLRQFQDGVQQIYELDTAFTDLKKVTEATNEEYAQFGRDASLIANQIGGLTVDVIKSATEWARLGYNIQQASVLAKETLVYQNVGDIKDAEHASQALISTIKGFGIEVDNQGKNVTKIVDIYNEVGNKFAISSAGIGEAMRRSASSMKEAGNTLEESVALITAANSTIQDPARVGNALKTIALRLQGISDEGEDLSNLLPTLDKKFNAIGLTLLNTDGSFKSTYQIFKDLSTVWKNLSDLQRADLLESVAGKLQANIAASIIQNFADAEGALKAGLNSMGSAAKENERYLDSMKGKLAQFKNEATQFWQSSMDSEIFKTAIDLGTKFIGILDNMGNVLTFTSGIILAFRYKALAGLITGAYESVTALFSTKAALQSTTVAAEGTTVAVNATSVAMTRLQRALGVIGLALTVGSVLYTEFNQINKSTEESNRLIEESNRKYSDHAEELKNVQSYYEQNFKSINSDVNVKDQLFQMQNKLIDTFGKEADGIDLVNGKYDEQIQKLKELKDKNLTDKINDNQIKVDALKETRFSNPTLNAGGSKALYGFGDNGYEVGGDSGVGNLDITEYYKRLLKLQEDIRNKNTDIFASQELLPKSGEDWNKALEAVQAKLKEIKPSIDIINSLEDDKKEKIKNSAIAQANFNAVQQSMFEQINNALKKQPTKEYEESISSIATVVKNFDGKSLLETVNAIKELPQIKANAGLMEDLNKLQASLSNLSRNGRTTSQIFSDLNKSFTDAAKEVKPLNELIQDLKNGKKMTADEVGELITKEEGFADAITVENGQIKVNIEAVEALRDAKIKAFQDSIKARENELELQAKALKEQLSFYANEIDGVKSLVEAKQKAAGLLLDVQTQMIAASGNEQLEMDLNAKAQAYRLAIKQIDDLDKAKARIETLKNASTSSLRSVGLSEPKKEKSESQLKDALLEQDLTKELINSFNAEYSARKKNIDLAKDQISLTEKQKDYNKAIEQTTSLIEQQNQALLDLSEANKKISAEAQSLRDKRPELDTESWFDVNGEASQAYKEFLNTFAKRSQVVRDNTALSVDARNKEIESIQDEQKAVETLFDHLYQLKKAWDENTNRTKEMQTEIDASRESINKFSQEVVDARFNLSKNWIDGEKGRGLLSLEDELAAWKRVAEAMKDDENELQAIRDAKTEKRKEAEKEVYRVYQEIHKNILDKEKEKQDKLKDIAKEVVESYKKSQEALRDAELDSIDKQIDAEKERHDKRMKNLDDEMDRFEQIVNDQIKLIDRQNASEDYESELKKKQQDAQKIQSQINTLALDDSIEANAKKRELEEDLAKKQEEIEEFKKERTRTIRKESLQDLVEVKKREVDANKKAEDQKFNDAQKALENLKSQREKYWKSIIDNDAVFMQMESDIIAGNVSKIQNQMESLKGKMATITNTIGEGIQQNLTKQLENALSLLQAVSSGGDLSGINLNSNAALEQKRSDHQKYISNKLEWQSIYGSTGKTDDPRQIKLQQENEVLRKKYNFPDYNYEDIIKGNIMRFDTGGLTPAFGTSPKLAWLDQKELVLNQFDTSNLLKAIDITRNLFNSFKLPNFSAIQPKLASAGDTNYHLTLNIDSLTGDKKGGETAFNTIVKGLQKLGKK